MKWCQVKIIILDLIIHSCRDNIWKSHCILLIWILLICVTFIRTCPNSCLGKSTRYIIKSHNFVIHANVADSDERQSSSLGHLSRLTLTHLTPTVSLFIFSVYTNRSIFPAEDPKTVYLLRVSSKRKDIKTKSTPLHSTISYSKISVWHTADKIDAISPAAAYSRLLLLKYCQR